jgi:hypothetical protein
MNKLLSLIAGLAILILWWIYFDDRLKGVVFFWFIPFFGVVLILASIGYYDKDSNK